MKKQKGTPGRRSRDGKENAMSMKSRKEQIEDVEFYLDKWEESEPEIREEIRDFISSETDWNREDITDNRRMAEWLIDNRDGIFQKSELVSEAIDIALDEYSY